MTPYESQYTPPREFTSVSLEDLYPLGVYPLGSPASDPSLTTYVNEEGYVVAILPETGGMDFEGAAGVVFFVGIVMLFVILASGIGGQK